MTQRFKIGSKVVLNEIGKENECYSKFRDDVLTVSHVSKSTKDHPGFDASTDAALYDFHSIPCSLYDWELEST